jgi:trk system potassium uptake protein TrkA
VKRVAVRAISEMAASILKRLGAHDIFFVESEMGIEIAHKLYRPSIVQEMQLGGGYRIIQWDPPKSFHGKTLAELSLPRIFNVQVVAIKSVDEESAIQIPSAATVIQPGVRLMVCGHGNDLRRLVTG